jgi:hypothetical protein
VGIIGNVHVLHDFTILQAFDVVDTESMPMSTEVRMFFGVSGQGTKEQIIPRLEHAETATFPLLALPTELRLRVYELYFDSLEEMPIRFVSPPITRVKDLRPENYHYFTAAARSVQSTKAPIFA